MVKTSTSRQTVEIRLQERAAHLLHRTGMPSLSAVLESLEFYPDALGDAWSEADALLGDLLAFLEGTSP